MLHGVYTAYQHGLNRILLSSQAPMHAENTNCFSSTDGAVQPRSHSPNCLPLNNCISPHYTTLITLHPCILMRQVLYSLDVFISTTAGAFSSFPSDTLTCSVVISDESVGRLDFVEIHTAGFNFHRACETCAFITFSPFRHQFITITSIIA